MARLLDTVSQTSGCKVNLHIHGHDRDPKGYFTEGGNQLCPVIFGAPDSEKRYLWLNLSANYVALDDIRDGIEMLRLY